MFKFFRKDETKRLQALYLKKLEEARDLQRKGDIEGFAVVTAEAEEIGKQVEAAKERQG